MLDCGVANIQETPVCGDRLINTLQLCFQNLMTKQEEQADKLHKALEALKPVQAADPKSAFWNAYMKLADEYDKEFQQKHGTDLDTCLIFAGLFSTVSSAFIIQIQPEFAMGSPSLKTIVAQSMLYISLFVTLLAALLAFLGKQWIMHFQAAGSRGTAEHRGLDRQFKLDGLKKWKFDTVLQLFPLLLQLALLLFATALSIYLWKINLAIAIITASLTTTGFVAYFLLQGSSLIFHDSPFQSPLTPLLLKIWDYIKQLWDKIWTALRPTLQQHIYKPIISSFSRLSQFIKSHGFRPLEFTSGVSPARSMFYESSHSYLVAPSVEVPAVVWVLENSTDPAMIDHATEMGVNLQWPLTELHVLPVMVQVGDYFKSCFEVETGKLRPGDNMLHRAVQSGKLYCSLRLINRFSKRIPIYSEVDLNFEYMHWFLKYFIIPEQSSSALDDAAECALLSTTIQLMRDSPEWVIDWSYPAASEWALYIYPAFNHTQSLRLSMEKFLDQFKTLPRLDDKGFTNYLCCLNSMLGSVSPQVATQLDKRNFRSGLTIDLFRHIKRTDLETPLIAQIMHTSAQLLSQVASLRSLLPSASIGHLLAEISEFLGNSQLVGQLDIVVSAASLCNLGNQTDCSKLYELEIPLGPQCLDSVLQAIEQMESKSHDADHSCAIAGLLQILASNSYPVNPSSSVLKIILHALHDKPLSLLAAMVLDRKGWMLDPELQPVLKAFGVWSHLSQVAHDHPYYFGDEYMAIGAKVAPMNIWQPAIYSDLSTWISTYEKSGQMYTKNQNFVSVLRNLWLPDYHTRFTDGSYTIVEIWAMVVAVLAKVWCSFQFNSGLPRYMDLAHCTVSVILQVTSGRYRLSLQGTWRDKCYPELGTALIQAAQHARDASHIVNKPALQRITNFLSTLGAKIQTELTPGGGEVNIGGNMKKYQDWNGLKEILMMELAAIEEYWKSVQLS
ncbi:hypothetical protein FB45DRAFT_946466 [Roridomyces roridus]|uniref:DUF6535 domain-containing protein n=1 Tax=Roridomyces roridus TaxID=1738132 RepID=A0AAD7FA78_9AGAR|nr:hypothetical protein FB45DRAFT_946466 [Roridomyces roridus]